MSDHNIIDNRSIKLIDKRRSATGEEIKIVEENVEGKMR